MKRLKKLLSLILGVMLMTMQLSACADEPRLITENGKIIVTNAAENGTLIAAFYQSGVLIGARTYKGGNKMEIDIKSELNGDLSDATDLKAFFWDMETIRPLCNLLPLKLGTAEPANTPTSTPEPTPALTPEPTPTPTKQPNRVLTVYFSFTDNTKALAEKIQNITGSDIYEITPQEPYTDEILNYYGDNRAHREQNDANARPAISGSVEGMDNYDVIMLGYPIWYGIAPRVVYTFLESYDFSGKTIMPFCTSGSTPISGSLSDIRKLCPNSTVTEGFRGTSSTTDAQIQAWIDNNIKENDTGMKIRIGDKSFTATLEDNDTANALKAMLPMNLDMSELNGNEKYYYLSQNLPTKTESIGTIHAGDIMLYGSSCIVIFYETFNTSYSYTRIGHIDDVTELKSALGSGDVNVGFEIH